MAALAAPVRVSPLIKFGRWSFLLMGVAWGAARQSRLSKKEAAYREVEEKNRKVREIQLAEEKLRLGKEEMVNLAKMGLPLTPELAGK